MVIHYISQCSDGNTLHDSVVMVIHYITQYGDDNTLQQSIYNFYAKLVWTQN